jgi:hypothetical protein
MRTRPGATGINTIAIYPSLYNSSARQVSSITLAAVGVTGAPAFPLLVNAVWHTHCFLALRWCLLVHMVHVCLQDSSFWGLLLHDTFVLE